MHQGHLPSANSCFRSKPSKSSETSSKRGSSTRHHTYKQTNKTGKKQYIRNKKL